MADTINGQLEFTGSLHGTLTISKALKVQENKTVTPGSEQLEVLPDEGFDVLQRVTVGAVAPDKLELAVSENGLDEFTNEDETVRSIRIGKVVAPNATRIDDYAFYGMNTLGEVNAPNATEVGWFAFDHCHSLSKLSLGILTTVGINGFYYAGNRAENTEVDLVVSASTLPDSAFAYANMRNIKFTGLTSLASGVFSNCKAVKAEFPELLEITGNAFSRCEFGTLSLPKLATLPSSGEGFGYCKTADLTLPEVSTINQNNFRYADIPILRLPKCTNIGNAFRGASVKDLWLGANTMAVLNSAVSVAFMSCPIYTDPEAKVHVRSELMSDYVNDQFWSAVASKIVDDYE